MSVCATNANTRNLLDSASKIRVCSYSEHPGSKIPDLGRPSGHGVSGILENAPVRTIARESEMFNGMNYVGCQEHALILSD